MLSTRAKKTIRKMSCWCRGGDTGGWGWSGGFELIEPGGVRQDLISAKKEGILKGIGQTTINEIVEFQETLVEVWGKKP